MDSVVRRSVYAKMVWCQGKRDSRHWPGLAGAITRISPFSLIALLTEGDESFYLYFVLLCSFVGSGLMAFIQYQGRDDGLRWSKQVRDRLFFLGRYQPGNNQPPVQLWKMPPIEAPAVIGDLQSCQFARTLLGFMTSYEYET